MNSYEKIKCTRATEYLMGDQPSSILTASQREYLRGEKEPTHERIMRTRIRERVRAGIRDLALLIEKMSDEDIEQTFDPKTIHQQTARRNDNDVPMWALPGFLYAATPEGETRSASDLFSDEVDGLSTSSCELQTSLTERVIKFGIEEVIFQRENAVASVESSVSVSHERTVLDLDDLDTSELALLPRARLDRLARAGELDAETYGEALFERFKQIEDGNIDDMEFRE